MNTTGTTLSPPVFAARDTRRSYGKGTVRFAALAGASLSVPAGESIAIAGRRRVPQIRSPPNGAGGPPTLRRPTV